MRRSGFAKKLIGLGLGIWIFLVSGSVMAYTYWNDRQMDVGARLVSDEREWEVVNSVPTSVEIERLGISVNVVPGRVVNNEWELSDDSASYLIGSGLVGEVGNVVMYAHKRDGLFRGLNGIEVGDEIQVTSRDVVAVYEVRDSFETVADDVSVLDNSIVPEITLYTCNRWNDSHRYVVKARLVKKWKNGLGGLSVGDLSASESAEAK